MGDAAQAELNGMYHLMNHHLPEVKLKTHTPVIVPLQVRVKLPSGICLSAAHTYRLLFIYHQFTGLVTIWYLF